MKYWLDVIVPSIRTQSLVNLLADKYQIGKGKIYTMIKNKNILINNQKINNSYRLRTNDHLIIKFPLANENNTINLFDIKPNNMDDNFHHYKDKLQPMIIYENDNFLVINKPCKWSTQNGINCKYNIDDLLTYHLNQHYLVHRIDKDTSGLLIVAKNRPWARILGDLIKQHNFHKQYILIIPKINKDIWSVESYIPKDEELDYIGLVNNLEPNSKTNFEKIKDIGMYSIVKAHLITGKKHQIRIHCSINGYPIIGDKKYGNNDYKRLLLHSYKISFNYEKCYEFKCPIDFFKNI